MSQPRRSRMMQIEKRKRLLALEECLLQGHTNQISLAAKFGVTQACISQNLIVIYDSWAKSGPDSIKARRALRVKQLEYVIRVASDGYQRSQKNSKEVSTLRKEVPCETCTGLGRIPGGKRCKVCEGDGTIVQEINTDRVRGRAGDPSFLKVVTACLAEINRLEGNYRPKRLDKQVQIKGQVLHAHLHKNQDGTNLYSTAPADELIAAKQALEKLRESTKPKNQKTLISLSPKEEE